MTKSHGANLFISSHRRLAASFATLALQEHIVPYSHCYGSGILTANISNSIDWDSRYGFFFLPLVTALLVSKLFKMSSPFYYNVQMCKNLR